MLYVVNDVLTESQR